MMMHSVERGLRCLAAVLAVGLLAGCLNSDNEDAVTEAVLTGTWTLSQATVNGVTLGTGAFGTATLTLNADGTLEVTGALTGNPSSTYTGTYTTSGNTISFTVPAVPATAGITMPLTATYEFDADSLELQLSAPLTISGTTVSAVFLVR